LTAQRAPLALPLFNFTHFCGFAFGHAEKYFHDAHARHFALKGLIKK